MFQVSEAYLERMMHHGTRRRLSGTIGSVAFSNDDVKKDSLLITGKAAESSDMKVGGVYLGEMSMTFLPSFLEKISKADYSGKEVSISIGLWIPDPEDEEDGGDWVDVPCGVFTLDEESPQLSKEGVAVTGVDHMAKFDKKFSINTTSSTLYGYLYYACQECGVTLGNTEEEIRSWYNGNDIIPLYAPNDIETFRDLIYWVAQACARFACCDRYGRLVLRKFGNPTSVVFDEDHRDDDVTFSGYVTKWTGISVVNIRTQYTNYYGLPIDNGLTMNLGSNPLLQLGSVDEVERRRRAVLQGVSEIQYTPFYMNSARDPIFDLGDEINFTGGISGTCTGCVMSFSYSMANSNFEGYGDKPSLTNALSKSDKNISGLMKATAENQITYYIYTNLDAISLEPETEERIAKLRFTAMQRTTVKIMHEFLFDMLADLASDCSYELRYYLDDELLTYKPYERLEGISQLTEGDDTEFSIARDLYYVLRNVEANVLHTWEVKMITHGISRTDIDINHIHITLEGQRLYGEDYVGGFLEAQDDLELFTLGGLGLLALEDSAVIKINPVEEFNITTEDGDDITTEDSDDIIW